LYNYARSSPCENVSVHPAAGLAEIVRIGIRRRTGQSYKQLEDEPSRAGLLDRLRVRSDSAIGRHQALLVNCGFSFCWDYLGFAGYPQ
jgi:hypothetical protein